MATLAATQSRTNDTAAEAAAAWRACIRDLSPAERLAKGCTLSQRGRRFAMEAIRRRHPTASPTEVRLRFIEIAFGPALAAEVGGWLEERDR
jgi:hypothetical protein